eukprot:UN26310
MDDVAMYSVTDKAVADVQSEIILNFAPIGKKSIITDGTACVGGNVYSFSQYFKHVNAFEWDKTRHEYLAHNMKILNVKNVICEHGDYTKDHGQFDENIIFWTRRGAVRIINLKIY